MGSDRKPAAPQASPDRSQARADERDRKAHLRALAADERDRKADLRADAADERDRKADLRADAADERDRKADLRAWRSASDREEPLLPGANGTLMARAMGAGRGCRPSPRHPLGRSGVRDRRPRRSGHAADSWQLARVNDRQVP